MVWTGMDGGDLGVKVQVRKYRGKPRLTFVLDQGMEVSKSQPEPK